MVINPEDTGAAFKEQALALYNTEKQDNQLTLDGFRLRNPNHDLGEIVHDTTILDSIYLTDEKEFYIHPLQEGKYFPYEPEIEHSKSSISILIREWDPETWQLSPVKEIQVPKTLKAADFGKYIHSKFFPHLPAQHFWGCRITLVRMFYRSDLVMKKWNHMITTPNTDLNLRDGQLFIVKDNSKTVRLELTEEELKKYANQSFHDHIKKKSEAVGAQPQHKNYDALFEAASNRKVDWSKPNRPEKGVSIQVGIEQNDDGAKPKEDSEEEGDGDGEIYIEELF